MCYTLCEYTSCEVVLRTMFCRLQNIHRAVLVASLVRGTDSPLLELLPFSPSRRMYIRLRVESEDFRS